jgi:hypothetical protein
LDIAFSSDGQVLHTNAGDISLLSSAVLLQSGQQTQSSKFPVQNQWMLRNQQRFLWHPSEYQSHATAVDNNIVCLGNVSGYVVLLGILPLFTIQCRTPPNAATPHPTNIP